MAATQITQKDIQTFLNEKNNRANVRKYLESLYEKYTKTPSDNINALNVCGMNKPFKRIQNILCEAFKDNSQTWFKVLETDESKEKYARRIMDILSIYYDMLLRSHIRITKMLNKNATDEVCYMGTVFDVKKFKNKKNEIGYCVTIHVVCALLKTPEDMSEINEDFINKNLFVSCNGENVNGFINIFTNSLTDIFDSGIRKGQFIDVLLYRNKSKGTLEGSFFNNEIFEHILDIVYTIENKSEQVKHLFYLNKHLCAGAHNTNLVNSLDSNLENILLAFEKEDKEIMKQEGKLKEEPQEEPQEEEPQEEEPQEEPQEEEPQEEPQEEEPQENIL